VVTGAGGVGFHALRRWISRRCRLLHDREARILLAFAQPWLIPRMVPPADPHDGCPVNST
jgi:hypothetical protein